MLPFTGNEKSGAVIVFSGAVHKNSFGKKEAIVGEEYAFRLFFSVPMYYNTWNKYIHGKGGYRDGNEFAPEKNNGRGCY